MVEMTKTMLRCIFFYINIKITKWMYGKKDEEEFGGYESTSGKWECSLVYLPKPYQIK